MPIAPEVSTRRDPLPIGRGLRFSEPGQGDSGCGPGDRTVTAGAAPRSNDASDVVLPNAPSGLEQRLLQPGELCKRSGSGRIV